MMVKLEGPARPSAVPWRPVPACRGAGPGRNRRWRVQAAEAYRFCAAEAIQLHGGSVSPGEYDPNFIFGAPSGAPVVRHPRRLAHDAVADSLLGRRNSA